MSQESLLSSLKPRQLWKSLGLSESIRIGGSRFWIFPLVAAVLLMASGWYGLHLVSGAIEQKLTDELRTVVESSAASLRFWMDEQVLAVQQAASEVGIRREVEKVAASADRQAADRLHEVLLPLCRIRGFAGYVVLDDSSVVVAASEEELIGDRQLGEKIAGDLSRTLRGESVVTHPFGSVVALPSADGVQRTGQPTMLALSATRDSVGRIVGVLGLRIDPATSFNRIFRTSRFGEVGDLYAFNRSGLMLTPSLFERQLHEQGLLPTGPGTGSVLRTQLREPEGERAPTRLARLAASGPSGVELRPYRNYRGASVVGAWEWLPQFDLGVALEVDAAEADRPVAVLRHVTVGLLAILALCTLVIAAAWVLLFRFQRMASAALANAQECGQYTLEEQIGEGGMGRVYRARHAQLRRPTAVKVLNMKNVREDMLATERFVQEVEVTSQLSHPNTVTVYDYGRTAAGELYYAMEYLDGLTLHQLVAQNGPQPEGRVVHILMQVCGSLEEAHQKGTLHRDIKPENIMLLELGGWPDFVKVLDFGLAKVLERRGDARLTRVNAVAGTPMYLAPERIEDSELVDARSDVYSVGGVGYFLLTGQPVFGGKTAQEVMVKQLRAKPVPPSERLGRPLNKDLEEVILSCLEKDMSQRPKSAADLACALAACMAPDSWTLVSAKRWWQLYQQKTSMQGVRTAILPQLQAAKLREGQSRVEYELDSGAMNSSQMASDTETK